MADPAPLASTLDSASLHPGIPAFAATLERVGDGEQVVARSPVAGATAPPRTQLGRYKLLRLLGEGGMGVVHTAYDEMLDRVVALKTLRAERSHSGVGRFIREAKALARLSHPNIVQIYDVSAAGGQVFLAMEYVEGQTLRDWLAVRPADAPVEPLLELFIQAGRGLEAAHRAGLVHRDFKPDNVMVGVDGRVRVTDFGLVRVASEVEIGDALVTTDSTHDNLTMTGSVLGTPAYMAPEQHRGAEADQRADVFSFCASLYEALYRERPFMADSYEAVRSASLSGAVRPPGQARVPAWLREVVLRGLRVDPASRWDGMHSLLAALADDPLRRRGRTVRRLALTLLIAGLGVGATTMTLALHRDYQQGRVEAQAAEHLASVEAETDPGRAEAAFRAFVTDPAHQGTRALGRAWQGRGDRYRAAGDRAAALADYARAYADAHDPAEAHAAMRRIAAIHLEGPDTDALTRAVQALPFEPEDRNGVDLLVAAALRRRDITGAGDLLAAAPTATLAAAGPLLAALGRAHPIATSAIEAVALPPGGPWVAAVLDDSRHEVVLIDRALHPGRRFHADEFISLVPGSTHAVTRRGHTGELFDVTAPERVIARFPAPLDVLPRGFLDADRSGQPELYYGYSSPMHGFEALDLGATAPAPTVAHAGSERTHSDLESMLAADLDGDGTQEIVASFGTHRAYDLRVFHTNAGGELELVHRLPFGRVHAVGVLRRPDGSNALVATHDADAPNAELFPTPPHLGAQPGVYLFEWTGSQLLERTHLPQPADPLQTLTRGMTVADLDGDGREELALSLRIGDNFHTLLIRQADDGALQPLVLGHGTPILALQLDDDPASELLFSDRDTHVSWALGVGEVALPPVSAPEHASVPPPPGLTDELLLARWTRAHELAAMSLPATAAESLRDAAAFVADPAVRRRVRDRAAALFASAGETEAALELDADLVTDPALAAGALLRRAELLTGLGRHAEAATAADEALAQPQLDPAQQASAQALLDRLAPLLDLRDRVDLRFDEPLAPQWRLERPAALHRDATGGALRIEALGTQPRLASLPVRWDGGPLQIEVEFDVVHAEYHTMLRVGLFTADERPLLGVGLGGGGDRKRRFHNIDCQPVAQVARDLVAHDVPSAATPHRVVVRAAYFPDRGVTECAVDDAGRRTRSEVRATLPAMPGEFSLVLGNLGNVFGPHLLVADIRRITIHGARLVAPTSDFADREQRAARALVEGEPLAALAVLAEPGPPTPMQALLTLLAHDDLHDGGGVARTVDAALAGLADPDLLHLLRTRPGLVPTVHAAAGPRLLPLLVDGWRQLARHHFDDREMQRRLLAALRGVEALPAPDDARRQALCALLYARANIHRQIGEPQRARRDHEAALLALGDAPDPPERSLRAEVHLALALLLADGEPELAREHAARAIACDAAPELVHDRLRREPALADRIARVPAWQALLAADVPPTACRGPAPGPLARSPAPTAGIVNGAAQP